MKTTLSLGLLACLFFIAIPAIAAPASYQYNGKTFYVVDGNNPNLNSGDRVCQSVGLKCVGYVPNTMKICQYFHPTAATNANSVNGSSAGYYCNGNPKQTDLACKGNSNLCGTCPACGINADCSTQVGDNHFAEMYVECTGTSTAPAQTPTVPPVPAGPSFWQSILAGWTNFWAALGFGNSVSPATPVPSHSSGTKLPAEICSNGGECKSGNCVREDQGVYRCSCSPIANDYSSCH